MSTETPRLEEQLRQVMAQYGVEDRVEVVQEFYRRLVEANREQNLTRLTSPGDFIEGHLLDVLELGRAGLVDYPALDLGSGCGVPGLLSACVWPEKKWFLVESEQAKAGFLSFTAEGMGLSNVKVFTGRVETVLPRIRIESVVVRAVGRIEKILTWIENCSTWNTLVLLKGPAWDELEWPEFQKNKLRKRVDLRVRHDYEVGQEKKKRAILVFSRVPRGTKKF